MDMRQALETVRHKFEQEQGYGNPDPELVAEYEPALDEYPATMKIAHVVWGIKFAES